MMYMLCLFCFVIFWWIAFYHILSLRLRDRMPIEEGEAPKITIDVYQQPSKLRSRWIKKKRMLQFLSFPVSLYYILNLICFCSGYIVGVLMFQSGLLPFAMAFVFLSLPDIFLNILSSKQLSRKLGFLETAMSLITNTYYMNSDIVESIEKCMDQIDYKDPFYGFLYDINVLGFGTKKALENMCLREPNSSFHAWVDILIMCQDNRTLKSGLSSIIDQMNDLYKAQLEADTAMTVIWKDYITLVVMICAIPILLRIVFHELYMILVTTQIGQGLMIAMIIAIFYSVRQAVKVNRPIMME